MSVENEFKFGFDHEDALHAVIHAAAGQAEPPVLQVNHFFDSQDGRLRKAQCILRLREEGARVFLTAKGPGRLGSGGLHQAHETEVEIDAPTSRAVLEGRTSPLTLLHERAAARPALLQTFTEILGGAPLRELGSFENRRQRVHASLPVAGKDVALVLELDRTVFPGGQVDCELEVEVPHGVESDALGLALRQLVARAGARERPTTSKSKRFFSALGL